MRIDRRKGVPETGYGQLAAIRQLKRKMAKKAEASRKRLEKNGGKASGKPAPISARSKKPKAPNIEVYMLDKPNAQVTDPQIDWNDTNTQTISAQLTQYENSDHQKRILVMPAGTGKTAVVVNTLGNLQQEFRKKHADFDQDAAISYAETQEVIANKTYKQSLKSSPKWIIDDDGQLLLPFVISAPPAVVSGANWTYTINEYNLAHPDNQLKPLIVTSFERLASLNQYGDSNGWMSMLLGTDGVIVNDEIHNYKNPTSKRSKQLQKSTFSRRIGLSATPFTNDILMDSISYLIYAGFYRNKTDFMRQSELDDPRYKGRFGEFLVYDDNGGISPEIFPYQKTMQQELSDVIYRPDIDISDINMPERISKIIQVKGDDLLLPDLGSLARAYLNKRAFESVGDYRMAVIERIAKDQTRVDEMLKIVQDKNTRQPLIFYWHNNVLAVLEQALKDHGIHYQIQNSAHPYAELDLELKDPILIQYQSGGAGIEFKNSNTSIYYQLQASATIDDQSKGRNVRRGMSSKVHQHYLMGPSVYEHGIYELCQQRLKVDQSTLDELAISSAKDMIK